MALQHQRFWGSPKPLLPAEASKEFQNLIEPLPVDDQQGFAENDFVGIPEEADEKSRTRPTLASFGDEGTTASINAYGQIIQISRFLGVGTSGFFCAQPWEIAVPNLFGHSLNLWDLVTLQEHFIGLQLPSSLLPQEPPMLRFLHNRWPRLDYRTEHYQVSLQYSCHNDTISQTYVFESFDEGTSISPEHLDAIGFGSERQFIVHDLVPIETESVPKYRPRWYQPIAPVPNDYGLIRLMDWRSYGLADAEAVQTVTSVATHGADAKRNPHIGLLMAPFVNGTPRKVLQRKDGSLGYSIDFAPELAVTPKCVEITVLNRLQHLQQPKIWEKDMMSIKDLSKMREAMRQTCFTPIQYSSQPHLNFIISRNLEHVLSVCSVPVMNSEKLTGEKVTIGENAQASGSNGTSEQDICQQNRARGGSEASKTTDSDNSETSGKESRETSTKSRDRTSTGFPHGTCAAANSEFRDGNRAVVKGELVLTCGDLRGHTIETQSSFFAFKFLLSVLAFLEEKRKAPASLHEHVCTPEQAADECRVCRSIAKYCDQLRDRIRCTCMRHLEWVASVGHKMSETFPFVAKNTSPFNFFSASGRVPKSWDNQGNSNNGLVLEAPCHILKFGEFQPLLSDTELHPDVFSKVASFVKCWLKALKRADKRNSRAVPRSADGGVNNFRLADHAWIWCALRCVEQLQPRLELYGLRSLGDWTANEFQINILKRFTTESPYSKQPNPKGKAKPKSQMLAVARSSLENRFLFHNKDTSLFYAMDSGPGFFSAPELDRTNEVWIATVQSQQDHDENTDTSWTKTLRYALAIIMAQKGVRINQRKTSDMFFTAKQVLLQSTSPSGLFPGFLSSDRDPVYSMDQRKRSSHLQAMFEVPYVLFTYGQYDPGTEQEFEAQTRSGFEGNSSKSSVAARVTDCGRKESTVHQQRKGAVLLKANLRKTTPFNNLVDQKSIVEIQEEWLYNYPDFLDFCTEGLVSIKKPIYGPDTGFSFVLDVPKSKRTTQTSSMLPVVGQAKKSLKEGGMYALRGTTRTAEHAKKRFIMLSKIDDDMRHLSVQTSTPQEGENIKSFIRRHMNFGKYFFDDTTAALNRWETEFHLSYYVLFDTSESSQRSRDEKAVRFPGPSKAIHQESLSFRFVGDFFDRYWTCHFVKDNQDIKKAPDKLLELLEPRHAMSENERIKEPWMQRKVLELLLFDHMLDEMITSTSKIILETKKQVLGTKEAQKIETRRSEDVDRGDEPDSSALSDALSLCKTNSIAYFAVNKRWQVFQQILAVVEDDITENLETIEEWNRREKERYLERPRWTRNDERKYRGAISKLVASNERRILRLKRCRTNVQSLKTSLENRLQYMRDDLNAYFTTVTVIFLPLGFAVGIFSMNGVPGSTIWHGMAYTSAVALGITVFLLVNAQTVAAAITASWNYAIRLPITLLWQQLLILVQARKPNQDNSARGIYQECDLNSSNDVQLSDSGGR